MHLIEDHIRHQYASDVWLSDAVEYLHWDDMPYTGPELIADFIAMPL
ncbi:hypothetical protein [Brevibacterium sp. SMBL_HHYL_HB1]|nr:hypothetical protein [Brevibacterium sp. SMBL_HHYL_HB1]QUL80253.1 hypothetical protein IG171_05455 [Brevibacterium sp. SMBL_HHYL_HB1]